MATLDADDLLAIAGLITAALPAIAGAVLDEPVYPDGAEHPHTGFLTHLPDVGAGSPGGLPLLDGSGNLIIGNVSGDVQGRVIGDSDTPFEGVGVRVVGGGGSGTGTYTDTITDGDGNPLDGVRVQLSTDSGGSNRIYEAYTNASGVFVMSPDAGTYYVWLDRGGFSFTQGAQVVVS